MTETYYMYQIKLLKGGKFKQEIRYYKTKKDLNDFDLCGIPNFQEYQQGTFLRKDAMFMGAIDVDFDAPAPIVKLFTKVEVTGPEILGKIELLKSYSTRPVKMKSKPKKVNALRQPVITKERCTYCGVPLLLNGSKAHRTLDHVYPLSKGGVNAQANKVLCCICCNQLKADLLIEDFLVTIKENCHYPKFVKEEYYPSEATRSVMICNIQDFINNNELVEVSAGRFSYLELELVQ